MSVRPSPLFVDTSQMAWTILLIVCFLLGWEYVNFYVFFCKVNVCFDTINLFWKNDAKWKMRSRNKLADAKPTYCECYHYFFFKYFFNSLKFWKFLFFAGTRCRQRWWAINYYFLCKIKSIIILFELFCQIFIIELIFYFFCRDAMPLEMMGKVPLDMSQYLKIFATCRIPGLTKDSVRSCMTEPDPPKHILVMRNNHVNTLRKLCFLSSWMGYDHGDRFPFDFVPNGIPFWFKIERKAVTTIISHSIWKDMET